MGLFSIFTNKKEITETARRDFLRRSGRITDGTIVDSDTDDAGKEIVFYIYSVHGVDFESSEFLSDAQKENPLQYAPGARVGVRFDPKNHGNSMLI